MLKSTNHPNCVKLLDAFKSKSGKVYLIFGGCRGHAVRRTGWKAAGLLAFVCVKWCAHRGCPSGI